MFRAKAREWLQRYGLAELSGTATAYLGYFTGRGMFPDSEVAQAYIASVCETLGFYAVIVTRQILADRARARRRLQDYSWSDSAAMVRGLFMEFGVAEFLDTGFIRPLAMGGFARLLGPGLGIVLGKISADVTFYLPAILFYEMRKKWTRMQIHSLVSDSSAHAGASEIADRVEALAASEVFGNVAREDLEFFATMFERRDLADGDVLCRLGDEAGDVYVVKEGEVEVWLASGPPVATLGRSAVLGEFGMFTGARRTATLTAKGRAAILTLDYERFRRFMLAFPEGTIALLKTSVLRQVRNQEANVKNQEAG